MAKKKALLRQKKNLKRVEKAVKKLRQQGIEVNDVLSTPQEPEQKGNKALRFLKKVLPKITSKRSKQVEAEIPQPIIPKIKTKAKKPKRNTTKLTKQPKRIKQKRKKKEKLQPKIPLVDNEPSEYAENIQPKADRWKDFDDGLINIDTGEVYQKPPDWKYQEFDTMIINQFLNDISQFPVMAQPILTSWLNGMIETYGKPSVSIMLEQANQNGVWIRREIAYDRAKMIQMVSEMLEYLPNISNLEHEQMTEAFEYSEDWNDFS